MNRRDFMEKSGIIGATALMPNLSFSATIKPKYKMGLQLFTINQSMMKDPIGSLKAAKAMGYEDFEIYGFDGEKDTFYGIKSPDLGNIIADLNITTSSGHFGFSPFLNKPADDLKRFVDQCIKGAKALNMKYITWPWIAPEQRTLDNYKLMAKLLNQIGEQVKGAGLGFAYHNHGFEFDDHDGQNGYDIILKETDAALVKLQIDMYWVMHSSKLTPKQMIKSQPGRYVMWHIKDMDKVSRDYTELGNGSIDYTQILPNPKESGLEFYYLEQGGNFAQSQMQSIADSASFFKKNLQKYL
ncbi:MAG: sugar phosphate isomerase/epimerase [Bacteroidota bacterium]